MAHSPLPQHQSNLYHPSMQHLAGHGTNGPIPREQYMADEAVHLHSVYNSPMPQHAIPYPQYTQPPRFYQHHQYHDSGLYIQYDGLRGAHPNAAHHGHDQYDTPPPGSPTPSSSDGMRSDLVIRRAETSHPREVSRTSTRTRAARPRKTPKNKSNNENDGARLEAPYSEMAKGREQAIIAEMEAWVNRPVAVRLREIETGKNPGKVKRPMNCFMLYRKAYHALCSENNHQTKSKMCAQSWEVESQEIKERFHEWARVERENHQLAHPEYKFSPSKPGTEKTGRRKVVEDSSEESDLDDGELERNVRQKTDSSHTPASSSYTPYSREASTFPDFRANSAPPNQMLDRSSRFEDIYPGQPYPTPYNESELERGQYYQQVIQRNPTHPSYEDVIIRRAAGPAGPSGSEMQLATGMDYLGLPGGQDYNIMQPSGEVSQSIDPSLVQSNLGDFNPNSPVESLYYDGLQDEGRYWYRQYGLDPAMYETPVYFDGETMDAGHLQDPHPHEEVWGAESAEGARELQKYLNEP